MNVVVIYQSRTGNTRRAAELIGGAVVEHGHEAAVRSVDNLDFKELAEADLVFVGSWVDGLILFGHRVGDTGRVKRIPKLWDKDVVTFMTYAAHAGNAIEKMNELLEGHGANVIAGRVLHRRRLAVEAPALVDDVLQRVPA